MVPEGQTVCQTCSIDSIDRNLLIFLQAGGLKEKLRTVGFTPGDPTGNQTPTRVKGQVDREILKIGLASITDA